MAGKKRILFIGTGHLNALDEIVYDREPEEVVRKLQERYEVGVFFHLVFQRECILNHFQKEKENYDGIVTHVPPLDMESLYRKSFEMVENLQKIKPGIPIIAYTSDPNAIALFSGSTKFEGISRRTSNPENDAKELENALEKVLK